VRIVSADFQNARTSHQGATKADRLDRTLS
jgi:hypothetical protein